MLPSKQTGRRRTGTLTVEAVSLDQRFLSPKEIAKRLGVSVDVVRNRFRKIPGVLVIGDGPRKSIRVPQSVFEAWLRSQMVEGL